MKIETGENGQIVLSEVYNGIKLKTDDDETLNIVMRDSGFELNYMGNKFECKDGKINESESKLWGIYHRDGLRDKLMKIYINPNDAYEKAIRLNMRGNILSGHYIVGEVCDYECNRFIKSKEMEYENYSKLELNEGDWLWNDKYREANKIKYIKGNLVKFCFEFSNSSLNVGGLDFIENSSHYRYATTKEINEKLDRELKKILWS